MEDFDFNTLPTRPNNAPASTAPDPTKVVSRLATLFEGSQISPSNGADPSSEVNTPWPAELRPFIPGYRAEMIWGPALGMAPKEAACLPSASNGRFSANDSHDPKQKEASPSSSTDIRKPFIHSFRDEKWEALAGAAAEERKDYLRGLKQKHPPEEIAPASQDHPPAPSFQGAGWDDLVAAARGDEEARKRSGVAAKADFGLPLAWSTPNELRTGPAASAGLRPKSITTRRPQIERQKPAPTTNLRRQRKQTYRSVQQTGRAHEGSPGICELCNQGSYITKHHVFPRSITKKHADYFTPTQQHATVDLCWPCHETCHKLITNQMLAQNFHSIAALKSHSGIQAYLATRPAPVPAQIGSAILAPASGSAQRDPASSRATNHSSRLSKVYVVPHLQATLGRIWAEYGNQFPQLTMFNWSSWSILLSKMRTTMQSNGLMVESQWVDEFQTEIKMMLAADPKYAAWHRWLFPSSTLRGSVNPVPPGVIQRPPMTLQTSQMQSRIREALRQVWVECGNTFPRWSNNQGKKKPATLRKHLKKRCGAIDVDAKNIRSVMRAIPEYRGWYLWVWSSGQDPPVSQLFAGSQPQNSGDDDIQEITAAEWQKVLSKKPNT